jgi:hypothetical protein
MQKVIPLTEYSTWHSWKNVSSEEMKAFFGVILNVVLNLKAQLVGYFTKEWLHRTLSSRIFLSSPFSPNILDAAFSSSCHSSQLVCTRGSNVKNVSEYTNNKCKELYVPVRNVTLD